jgi:hypothetical protein
MLAGMPVRFISLTAKALYVFKYSVALAGGGPEELLLRDALRAGLQELSSMIRIRIVYVARFFIRTVLAKI